jgi:hypothetical protein
LRGAHNVSVTTLAPEYFSEVSYSITDNGTFYVMYAKEGVEELIIPLCVRLI